MENAKNWETREKVPNAETFLFAKMRFVIFGKIDRQNGKFWKYAVVGYLKSEWNGVEWCGTVPWLIATLMLTVFMYYYTTW